MMRFSKAALYALAACFLVACGSNEVAYDNACGPLKDFTVDEAYCQQYNLTEQNFSLKYPADLEIETQAEVQTDNYVSFFKWDSDSAIVESINIGYYSGLSESGGDGLLGGLLGLTKESFMQRMVNQLNAQGLGMSNVTMQDETIRGEDHFTVRGEFETTEDYYGFLGKYRIQIVMMGTESDQGLLFLMIARNDSGIDSFDAFETKGCMAPILQSLS